MFKTRIVKEVYFDAHAWVIKKYFLCFLYSEKLCKTFEEALKIINNKENIYDSK